MKLFRGVALALLAASIGAGAARATDVREQQSVAVWHKQDECARAAFVKFPDYTAESNAKRDRATRDCEIRNHLPIRVPADEFPVKTIPDDAAN